MKQRQKDIEIAIEMELQSANTRTNKLKINIAMYVNSTKIGQKNQLSLGKFKVERKVKDNTTYTYVIFKSVLKLG